MRHYKNRDKMSKADRVAAMASQYDRYLMAKSVMISEHRIVNSYNDSRVRNFCNIHGISYSKYFNSFYFYDKSGRKYRVSNHTHCKQFCDRIYEDIMKNGCQKPIYRNEYKDFTEFIVPCGSYLPEIYSAVMSGKEVMTEFC